MDYFKRGLLINFSYYFMPSAFYTPPCHLVNHAKAEHFISQYVFTHGHFCSKLVLSIYTGKSWPKVL